MLYVTCDLSFQYNATDISVIGELGEDGYAWSIGVAVDFLSKYGDRLKAWSAAARTAGTTATQTIVVLVMARLVTNYSAF